MKPEEPYIPLDDCKDRHLYIISARNFRLGVFCRDKQGFIGIREKFGNRYLFTEYHWDTGEPHGTVCPRKEVGTIPDDLILREGQVEGEGDTKHYATNQPLFDYLDGMSPEVDKKG